MSFNKNTLNWKFITIEIKSNQVFSVFIQLYAVDVDRHTSTLQSVDWHSLLNTGRMSISLTCLSTKKYCTRHVDTTSRLIARHVDWHVVGNVDAPLGNTHTVKLKSQILKFRVAWILGDYATGRLKLRVALPKLKSPSRPVQRTSGNEFNKFPKTYQSASLCQVIQVVMTAW